MSLKISKGLEPAGARSVLLGSGVSIRRLPPSRLVLLELFVTQRYQRIDLRGLLRRNITSKQCDEHQ